MKEPKHAVIYPFLPEHIERILNGKDVICKYSGRGKPNLSEGSKVLFYASGGSLEMRGEAIIRKIEFLTPRQMLSTYERRLFLTPAEVERYRGLRSPDQSLLVLTLFRIRRFKRPIKKAKYVTMAGETLTQEQYERMLGPAI